MSYTVFNNVEHAVAASRNGGPVWRPVRFASSYGPAVPAV